MAELLLNEVPKRKLSFYKKSRISSTRVDLTPMVDLGFLLITFFIFTMTMTQATSMNLNMPKVSKVGIPVPRSGALTLLLGKENQINFYFGSGPETMQETNYKEVRNIILEKKKNTPPEKLFIIIKPDGDASYKNVVTILDEMSINDVSRYAIDDMSKAEHRIIKQSQISTLKK